MKQKHNTIEITAPVGSYECLAAAIQAGARSVYFGAGNLNMRAKSSNNFNIRDLKKISTLCKKHNIKTYLAVNIVLYDSDIAQMKKIIDAAKRYSIDAIIATDMATILYANKISMPVHISTQCNISNYEAVKYYSQYADVMVLARELSLKQITEITKKIKKNNITGPSGNKVRIEIFTHGALCMSISGKCYLSLHQHNYSANRGECLQPCRRAYTVTQRDTGVSIDIENEYIMSPKDLCTIHFIDKIINSGVEILKIEGRARAPEYVKTVVSCYKEAVDAYFNGTYTQQKINNWKIQLQKVFNRDFWDGYYLGQQLGEWSNVYGSAATQKKVFVGKCMNYFKKINVADFLIQDSFLEQGDQVLIIGPTTGVIETTINELRIHNKAGHFKAERGVRCSFLLDKPIRKADKLYKIINT